MKADVIEILTENLNNKFLNNDVTVMFEGAINMSFIIHNFKYFITKNTFILSNGTNEELIIESYWISKVEFEGSAIKLYIEPNILLKIDC